ncbi:MAG TPA: nitroreductase family protein [Acidimicrobiales bacterium]|nr:nitroreductase family protein [Acidimicrobiales bacterium]
MPELIETMRGRHSTRVAFDPDTPIDGDDLRHILEAARWAPTAHNMQNFEVVVVDDAARREQIAQIRSGVSTVFVRENFAQLSFSEDELRHKKTGLLATMFPSSWLNPDPDPAAIADPEHAFLGTAIGSAPMLLVVVYDSTRRAPDSEGDILGIMSLGCVMENMWLMAGSLGIGLQILSAMSGQHVEKELQRVLEIPPAMKVAFGARLGYPRLPPRPYLRVRRDIGDFVHRNSFAAPFEA